MLTEEYFAWLQERRPTAAAVIHEIKRCQQVEDSLQIALDAEYQKDFGVFLLEQLTYTAEDARCGRLPKCAIAFAPEINLYKGMERLKTAVESYFAFLETRI